MRLYIPSLVWTGFSTVCGGCCHGVRPRLRATSTPRRASRPVTPVANTIYRLSTRLKTRTGSSLRVSIIIWTLCTSASRWRRNSIRSRLRSGTTSCRTRAPPIRVRRRCTGPPTNAVHATRRHGTRPCCTVSGRTRLTSVLSGSGHPVRINTSSASNTTSDPASNTIDRTPLGIAALCIGE